VFQVHLWSGICLGLYVLFLSATGSLLVYRNEMYAAAIPALGAEATGSIPAGIRFVSTRSRLVFGTRCERQSRVSEPDRPQSGGA
jgi:hypothetical protein